MRQDIGLGRALEMFEDRFGRGPTTALLALIGVGIAAVCINAAFSMILLPLWDALSRHFRPPDVTLVTLFYVTAFLVVAVLLVLAWNFLLSHRRVPQKIVDDLAELRSGAIHDILNGKVKSDSDLASWEAKEDNWHDRVLEKLRKHFTKAEVLGFDRLGVIPQVGFPHSFNNEHAFRLMMFAKRLSILEDIIRRHTR